MKTVKMYGSLAVVAVLVMAMMSFVSVQQKPKAWDVPANYKTMKNPVKSDAASIASGKTLWGQHCASCHGKAGLGDGPKARNLETSAGDFTKAPFTDGTDGEIFYRTKMGRGEMPKYDKKITDEDIWALVNYMRTMKK
ncbi:MAG: cytochrome c [Bacteroidales bacterium]